MKSKPFFVWMLSCLASVFCSSPSWAQSFSADLISRNPSESLPAARLYASDGNVRIDVPSSHAEGGPAYAAFTMWYIKGQVRLSPRPKKWTSDDAKREVIYFAELNNLVFQPTATADICGQYVSHMKTQSGASSRPDLMEILNHVACEDLGPDETNGRKTEKMRIAFPQNRPFTLWIDPEIHFVIKFVVSDAAFGELQNLKVEEQPAKLFELPGNARTLL